MRDDRSTDKLAVVSYFPPEQLFSTRRPPSGFVRCCRIGRTGSRRLLRVRPLCLDELHIQRDRHFVAYEDAAEFQERAFADEAEVFAIDPD